MNHKFRVGQTVRLVRPGPGDRTSGGVYTVVRLLPESNGEYGYRIKARDQLTERAVTEHDIAAMA
jgi:hypothetical protein